MANIHGVMGIGAPAPKTQEQSIDPRNPKNRKQRRALESKLRKKATELAGDLFKKQAK